MILGLSLSLLAGLSLGLLGGGGSILMVPILLYAMGMETHQAIVASLFVVAVTSSVGFMRHAMRGNVAWRHATVFGLFGMAGSFAGARLGYHLPGTLLLGLFTLMMVLTAIAMLRKGSSLKEGSGGSRGLWLVAFMTGGFTGMVGAGGGFLVTPALVFFAKTPMKKAIGSSLMVIAAQSIAGMWGYLSQMQMPWDVVLPVTVAAVVGAQGGVYFSSRVSGAQLRRGFAVFVLVMAGFILFREASTMWTEPPVMAPQTIEGF